MASSMVKGIIATVSVWLSGCGTVQNLCGDGGVGDGDKKVYGGVAASAEYAAYFAQGATDPQDLEHLLGCTAWGVCALAVDLPLSAAGDTLTLPITFHAALERWKSAHP